MILRVPYAGLFWHQYVYQLFIIIIVIIIIIIIIVVVIIIIITKRYHVFVYGTFHYIDDREQVIVLPSGVLEALQLQTCDASDVVTRLQESLSLTQASLGKPGKDTKRLIRCLCVKAKVVSRVDVVKKLREITPAGTTGEMFGYSFSQYVELSGEKCLV